MPRRSPRRGRARTARRARCTWPRAWAWASGLASTPVTRRRAGGQDVGAVALAAGHVDHVEPAAALGDPLVDREVAAVPVVLLGQVGQGPLARQRERRHALGLIRAGRTRRSASRLRSVWRPPVPLRFPAHGRARDSRGDPRGQRPLPRPRGRALRRQVGHRLRRARPAAGDREAAQGARAARPRPLRARARDRRRHRLLRPQPRARRRDRRVHGERHLARACSACWRRPAGYLGDRRRRRPAATPRGCRSTTTPSTSSSATRSSTTCPTSTRCFAELARVLRPGGVDRLRRRALALRRPPRRGAQARGAPRRAGLARADAREPAGRATASPRRSRRTTSSASSTSTPSPPGRSPDTRATAASTTSTSAARSSPRASSAGPTARSRRPPSRPRCRGSGASTPTAAT